MLVLIDNYDSFSYNLYQQIAQIYPKIKVIRNDELSVAQIAKLRPKGLIISPGPKAPKDAGICIEAIRFFAPQIPIFGVCLGHQAICEAFGGRVGYAPKIMHGKSSVIEICKDSALFDCMPSAFEVARYHSLAIIEDSLPPCLEIIARVSSAKSTPKSTPKSLESIKSKNKSSPKYKQKSKSAEQHLQKSENTIMAIAHKKYKTFGVQFHPESILTPLGNQIAKNFLAHIK